MPLTDQSSPPLSPQGTGSPEVLRELYMRHREAVLRVAYGITGSRSDAEDVLQDVFVGLPEALRTFQGRGSFEGWLKKVAVRTALSRLRRSRRRAEVPLESTSVLATHASPEDGIDRAALEAAIARLPDTLRTVFVLKVVEGYSHTEIGRLLGIRSATSEVRLHRARHLLRDLLGSLR